MAGGKSTRQVAREKGVSMRTAQRWAKKGKVSASKKTGHDWTVTSSGGAKRGKPGPRKGSKRRKKR